MRDRIKQALIFLELSKTSFGDRQKAYMEAAISILTEIVEGDEKF